MKKWTYIVSASLAVGTFGLVGCDTGEEAATIETDVPPVATVPDDPNVVVVPPTAGADADLEARPAGGVGTAENPVEPGLGTTIEREAGQTGAAIERNAGQAGTAIEREAGQAGSAIERGLERTGNALERGAEKTGNALESGVNRTQNAVSEEAK